MRLRRTIATFFLVVAIASAANATTAAVSVGISYPGLALGLHSTILFDISPSYWNALVLMDGELAGSGYDLSELVDHVAPQVDTDSFIDITTVYASCGGGIQAWYASTLFTLAGGPLGTQDVFVDTTEFLDMGCPTPSTPLLIDLDQNGFELSGLDDPVFFDVDADGVLEEMGWTDRRGRDAFLALDLNLNDLIDDGSELFGDATRLPDGSRAASGFSALVQYDAEEQGGNGDKWIDADDDVFRRLLVWVDRNHNGISERREIEALSELRHAPRRLYVVPSPLNRYDTHGNHFILAGGGVAMDLRPPTFRMVDVVFVNKEE